MRWRVDPDEKSLIELQKGLDPKSNSVSQLFLGCDPVLGPKSLLITTIREMSVDQQCSMLLYTKSTPPPKLSTFTHMIHRTVLLPSAFLMTPCGDPIPWLRNVILL